MTDRVFTVSDEVVAQARELGLLSAGPIGERVVFMATYAALYTHPQGNRRYHGWWMRIDKRHVSAIGRII